MKTPAGPSLGAKLACLAAKRGRDAKILAREAVESFVDYDEWFIREVERGLAQVDHGETLTHEHVGAHLERLFTAKQLRR